MTGVKYCISVTRPAPGSIHNARRSATWRVRSVTAEAVGLQVRQGRGEVPGQVVPLGGGLGRGGAANVRPVAPAGQGGSPELLQTSDYHRPAGGVQQRCQPHRPPRLRHAGSGLLVPEAEARITRLRSAKLTESRKYNC